MTQNVGVIYKITNLINKKTYIGQRRLNRISFIRSNYYGSGKYIKAAINKHGFQNFNREIIDTYLFKNEADKKEKYWIKKLNSIYPFGYNLTKGGGPYSPCSHTEEFIMKQHKKRIGKTYEELYGKEKANLIKKKQGILRKKWVLSDCSKKLISNTRKERIKIGLISLDNVRRSRIGSKHTEETKLLMSVNRTGKGLGYHRKHTEKTKKLIGIKCKGRIPPNKIPFYLKIKVICKNCKKIFSVLPNHKHRLFCNKLCYNIFRKVKESFGTA